MRSPDPGATQMAKSEHRKMPAGTQVVGRITSILNAFTAERPEWKLTPLAASLGLTKPTAHRLLAALEAEGFIEQDAESHHYRLGPTSAAIGVRAILGRNLRSRALPLLHALAADCQETCSLETRIGGQMRIDEEVTGGRLVDSSGCVGSLWPLHATSSGKAILAALGADRRRDLLSLPLERYTESTVTELHDFEHQLDRFADKGFAWAVDELEHGYSAVSVAVRIGTEDPVTALSIGGPSNRLDESRLHVLGERLRQSADQLAGLLIQGTP